MPIPTSYVNNLDELAPFLRLSTEGGTPIDFSGMDSLKMDIQLGAADTLEIKLPAQDSTGAWRSDMPMWQAGGTVKVEAGYNGKFKLIQKFELISTTNDYQEEGGESATVRGVSDLVRLARSKKARSFDYAPQGYGDVRAGADTHIISTICKEFGWLNGVSHTPLADPPKRVKENGKSDLDFLKLIAKEALIGGPRLRNDGVLIMPDPVVGKLKYARGISMKGGTGWRRLHQIQANRETGGVSTRVAVVSWDPKLNEYVEIEYEADEFGGDPRVTYEGKLASEGLAKPISNQGLALSVIEHRGQSKKDRVDVLSTGQFSNEHSATELVRRYFLNREKFGRWADITVDGNTDLLPYESIEVDGNLALADRGVWLPMKVSHTFNSSGWMCALRCIRVVDEAVVKPVSGNDATFPASS